MIKGKLRLGILFLVGLVLAIIGRLANINTWMTGHPHLQLPFYTYSHQASPSSVLSLYNFSRLSDYCRHEGSLHQIALQMAHLSSPPGSLSRKKALRVLQASRFYHVYLPPLGIFQNVAENVAVALHGFGLQPWAGQTNTRRDYDFIMLEISYYARNLGKGYACHDPSSNLNCSSIPRIILQSEQLEQVGPAYLEYLQECHRLPLCMIWDFSDYHFRWAQDRNFSDSVLLLPIMHQSLFQTFNKNNHPHSWSSLSKLSQRPLDVVFFGSLKERRQQLVRQLQNRDNTSSNNSTSFVVNPQPTHHHDHSNWTIRFDYSTNLSYIQESYHNAKICLIVHAYAAKSAGEYHRLHELATTSDCVPVVETFADTIGMDSYTTCGGVVFGPYASLVSTIHQVWHDIRHDSNGYYAQKQEMAFLWWQNKIQWDRLLVDIFNNSNT